MSDYWRDVYGVHPPSSPSSSSLSSSSSSTSSSTSSCSDGKFFLLTLVLDPRSVDVNDSGVI